MNKKVLGAVIGATVIAIVIGGVVYFKFLGDKNIPTQENEKTYSQAMDIIEKDKEDVSKIKIEEETGNLTAIVNGEAFAEDNSSSQIDTRTDEEFLKDLLEKAGASPSSEPSKEETQQSTAPSEPSKEEIPPTTNNKEEKPAKEPPSNKETPNTESNNTNEDTGSNSNVWIPPEGFEPMPGATIGDGSNDLHGIGTSIVPEEDKNITFS